MELPATAAGHPAGRVARRPSCATRTCSAEDYLLARPLLAAIEHPGPRPAVLLIDEVDRADDEFEAFLFEMLAEASVTIPELGTRRAAVPPIAVLTSNRTRDLHDALRRRCLYHWIDYPSADRVAEIIAPAGAAGVDVPRRRRSPNAVARMRSLALTKPPGVAEAINWAAALRAARADRTHRRRGRVDPGRRPQARRRPRRRPRVRPAGPGRRRWLSRRRPRRRSDSGSGRVVARFAGVLHAAGAAGRAGPGRAVRAGGDRGLAAIGARAALRARTRLSRSTTRTTPCWTGSSTPSSPASSTRPTAAATRTRR